MSVRCSPPAVLSGVSVSSFSAESAAVPSSSKFSSTITVTVSDSFSSWADSFVEAAILEGGVGSNRLY